MQEQLLPEKTVMYISAQLKSKPAVYPVQYKARENYEPAWMLKPASAGAPDGPFLLIQTAGPHTPYLLLTLPEALWLPMVLSMALGFPFAESTASCFICLFSRSATPITKENLCLTDELWERWYVREMVHRAKEENLNSSWKILQPQLDPDRDASHGIITGGGRQLHCTHKQSCKRQFFGQGQIYLISPPVYRLFQCHGAPNLLSLLRCRFPGPAPWVRLRRHL